MTSFSGISLKENAKFKSMLENFSEGDEIEFAFSKKFNHISLNKYLTLLEFFAASRKTEENPNGKDVEISYYLNVSYNKSDDYGKTYRISIVDTDTINDVVLPMYMRDNHIIFLMLLLKIKESLKNNLQTNDKIFVIEKTKNKADIVDIPELGVRLRKSKEKTLTGDEIDQVVPTHSERINISYRYIQRTSLIVEDTPEYTIRIDLSHVQQFNKISMMSSTNPGIELEIDVTAKKHVKGKTLEKICKNVDSTFKNLLKVLQKSNVILPPLEQSSVVEKMHKLLFPDKDLGLKDLPAMQSVSAELQHVVDYITNEYSVTDKADGERHFMCVLDGKLYLINNTNEVKIIESPDEISEFNNSIFDGEYIFLDHKQKFIFLIFDCLMFKGTDIRQNKHLIERLNCGKQFTEKLFDQKHFATKYSGNFDIDAIREHYTKDIVQSIQDLNRRIDSDASNIISLKYFAFPLGVEKWEIFFLTSLVNKLYTSNNELKVGKKIVKISCPYKLDGCMWTPIEQEYNRNRESTKNKIYKFKPSKYNSIDFYCVFMKDQTGSNINVYDDAEANSQQLNLSNKELTEKFENDDSTEIKPKGQIYQIVHLYVGKKIGNAEYPVLFHEDQDHHFAYIPVTDGQPRDVEGNIIQDKTVVEFTYKNELSIKPGSRWIALRTRYDKTDSVILNSRKYGNNVNIAESIWRSMIDGVELNDIELLGTPSTYLKHHEKLKSHITTTMIERERRENSFYNLMNELGKSLGHFHNWIKTNLIATYCGKKIINGKFEPLDVLDYGVGRGGDINKYLQARVRSVTGFDLDYFGIYSGSDSAISRYHTFKKQKNVLNFEMSFLVADGGALLTRRDQALAGIENSDLNNKTLARLFDNDNPKLYDAVSCQFVVHFFFKNDTTLNNFMTNIQRFTRPSGYVIITTFDMDIVHRDLVKGNGSSTSYYETKEGEKEIIFDVIKKYEGEPKDITGQMIDVHLPAFDKGKYYLEYLVPKNLLISKMKEYGFELVETDLFWNIYNKHRKFFNEATKYEKGKSEEYFKKTKEYYNAEDLMNQSTFPFTKKNRFYVFQKTDDGTKKRVIQNSYVEKVKNKFYVKR